MMDAEVTRTTQGEPTGASDVQEIVAQVLRTKGSLQAESCRLDLTIDDPLLVQELITHPQGDDRDAFALTALRIGVLAIKQAQGRLDSDVVRNEGERLLMAFEHQ